MTRVLLLLLAVASVCCAQQTFEIRGTVTEPGLGGVGGVEVRAITQRSVVSVDLATNRLLPVETPFRAFTNARGEFVLSLPAGEYQAFAARDGYTVMNSNSPWQTLDKDHPKGEATFEVARLVQVTGRVLDDETGKPIEGVRAILQSTGGGKTEFALANYSNVPVAILEEARRSGKLPVTNDRGVFQLTAMPGSYVLGILATPPKEGTAFSPEAAKAVDSEYEQVYWPGGLPLADVQPMQLGSGAVMNLGEMRLKKVQRYRVHIVLPQGQCPEGESVRMVIAQRGATQTRSVGAHKCGGDVVMQGLEPGLYGIYAVSDWQGERDNVEDAVWGRAEFEIKKENAEVAVDLHHGAILEGQLKAVEGFTGLPERVPIVVQPRDGLFEANVNREEFIEWGENGRFRLAVGPGRQTLESIVTRDIYMSRIVLNGIPAGDLTLDAKPGEKQRLEIELDNKLGTIEGTVEGPIRYVQLARNDGRAFLQVPVVNGAFRTSVPPGEYRIVDDSAALDLARSNGEKVVVKGGETAKVKLRKGN